jgi:hypothetical protein
MKSKQALLLPGGDIGSQSAGAARRRRSAIHFAMPVHGPWSAAPSWQYLYAQRPARFQVCVRILLSRRRDPAAAGRGDNIDLARARSFDVVSDDPPSDVLGALPRHRPQRRSQKRRAPASVDKPARAQSDPTAGPSRARANGRTQAAGRSRTATTPQVKRASRPAAQTRAQPARRSGRLPQPAQPSGVPPAPPTRGPLQPTGRDILGTAAQAAAELAEIGRSMSAWALRNAIARLPRP